jgi:hypothetical protein
MVAVTDEVAQALETTHCTVKAPLDGAVTVTVLTPVDGLLTEPAVVDHVYDATPGVTATV